MRVAFLYNRSSEDPSHAAEDEFPDESPLVATLNRLGHEVLPVVCTLDLETVRCLLLEYTPDVVFNRVESLGGSDSMMAAVTLLLDSMQLPYTGNSTEALVGTASKTSVKQRVALANMPTPVWFNRSGERNGVEHSLPDWQLITSSKYILKPDLEHASFAIDDTAIVEVTSLTELKDAICERELQFGRPYFAEEFISGREFNISIMGDPPQVLPPAEIDFTAFPSGKPRIVSHAAKWNEASFEFHHTPRRFEFPESNRELIDHLSALTLDCWRLFRLTGYARVDFRVDELGQPWILEINTNPCISPDAGFAAALEQSGIGYDDGIAAILNSAVSRFTNSPRMIHAT
jgi:D-alanine-D-alanine ligase